MKQTRDTETLLGAGDPAAFVKRSLDERDGTCRRRPRAGPARADQLDGGLDGLPAGRVVDLSAELGDGWRLVAAGEDPSGADS